MAAPMTASMPDNVDVGSAYTLEIAALDATSGSDVAGVTFSNMELEVVATGTGELAYGPFMLVPGPGA